MKTLTQVRVNETDCNAIILSGMHAQKDENNQII